MHNTQTPPPPLSTQPSAFDHLLAAVGDALATVFAKPSAARPYPAQQNLQTVDAPETTLTDAERTLSGALMRVNHVGEVCAQALYTAQALATQSPALKAQLLAAAKEETDHLAWTRQRLDELGARPSLLNPLWYAGAFAIGYTSGKAGDALSLGFVVETERQVEAHLASHLDRLPAADTASRQIVAAMQADEAAHGQAAQAAGAKTLPRPAQLAMQAVSKVMTTVAHRV